MFSTVGLTDRDILEKLLEINTQNHALICNLSKSMELEKHRQFDINTGFDRRIKCLEDDVKEIKKKIAV